MSREPRAHCAVSSAPSSSSFPPDTLLQTVLRRDLGEILKGFRQQRVWMPRTLYQNIHSLSLSFSMSLCCLFLRRNRAVFAFIFDYLARSPLFFVSRLLFPLFLSFNLRLDCRLHIVPSLPFTGLFLTSVHCFSHPYSFSPSPRFQTSFLRPEDSIGVALYFF